MLAAMRRASSRVKLGRPSLSRLLPVGVGGDEAGVGFLSGPGRREAAGTHGGSEWHGAAADGRGSAETRSVGAVADFHMAVASDKHFLVKLVFAAP